MSSSPVLKVTNLSVAFDKRVVNDLSFSIYPGKTTAIVGESGSGKTVSSMAVMGLLPTTATIESGDFTVLKVGVEISMVFQDPMSSLNPSMSVGEQVSEPLIVHENLSNETAREKTIELFKEVELLDAAAAYDKFPHELSGGQKQRVMIAMALACNPHVLIADEPTTALDVTVQSVILDLLSRLQKERNLGILFISHDLEVVKDIADEVIVMRLGDVVEQGECKKVFSNPQHEYTKELISSRPSRNGPGAESDGALIEARGVSLDYPVKKDFMGRTTEVFGAVKNVSLRVGARERVGLVGESGSGKSSLGKLLLGMEICSSGEILWKGETLDIENKKAFRVFKKCAQPVFQDPFSALNPRLRVCSALQEALDLSESKSKVSELLEEVGLSAEDASKYPSGFSGGQRQRIVLARALAMEPEFLVLDESVAALDLRIQAEILKLISDIQKKRSLAFLFISHDLSVIEAVCDRVVIMKNGEIVEEGATENIFKKPKNSYTKELLNSRPGA
ncbi:MAG: microcin C ABC transporter ATP-binding protein [Crocinitomicaceae bacterium]|nr:microcin C ABC transporter ATP-binding protein [Crocinitomicaceae bacterium]|tara:strand:+ start:2297 stop:3817 length:1521 start_codon:yes stop_codon:yes gene_type:complete